MPAELLTEPVNVMRLSLHPDAMGGRLVNLAEVRAHLLHQLRRQAEASGDGRLAELHDELAALHLSGRGPERGARAGPGRHPGAAADQARDRILSMFTTIATFGTPWT